MSNWILNAMPAIITRTNTHRIIYGQMHRVIVLRCYLEEIDSTPWYNHWARDTSFFQRRTESRSFGCGLWHKMVKNIYRLDFLINSHKHSLVAYRDVYMPKRVDRDARDTRIYLIRLYKQMEYFPRRYLCAAIIFCSRKIARSVATE
jgi:hypothetical protein